MTTVPNSSSPLPTNALHPSHRRYVPDPSQSSFHFSFHPLAAWAKQPYDDDDEEGEDDYDYEEEEEDGEAKAEQVHEGNDEHKAAAGRGHSSGGGGAAAAAAAAGPTPHPRGDPVPWQYPPFAIAGAQSQFHSPFSGPLPPPPPAFSQGGGGGHNSVTAARAARAARAAPAFGGDPSFLPGGGYGAPSALPYRQQQQQQQHYHNPHPHQQLQSLPSWEGGGNDGGWEAGAKLVPTRMHVEGERRTPPLGDW